MWYIIFITAFPCIFGAALKPMEPLEGPLWKNRLAEALLADEDYSSENSEIYQHRYPHEGSENTDLDYSIILRPPNDKRALAMFARWGSINSIGKNRPPVRSTLLDAEDALSTQTRGRTLGQPLRWG